MTVKVRAPWMFSALPGPIVVRVQPGSLAQSSTTARKELFALGVVVRALEANDAFAERRLLDGLVVRLANDGVDFVEAPALLCRKNGFRLLSARPIAPKSELTLEVENIGADAVFLSALVLTVDGGGVIYDHEAGIWRAS